MSRAFESISGIAGSIQGPGTELTPRPDLARIATAAQSIKSQQLADAQSKLGMALDLIDKGIIPEQSDWDKLLGEAGFSPETIQLLNEGKPLADGTPLPEGIAPADITKIGNALQGSDAGAQAANPPSPQAARQAPGGGVEQTVPEGTGTVERAVAGARAEATGPNAAPNAGDPLQALAQRSQDNALAVSQLRQSRGGLRALADRTLDRIDREVESAELAHQLESLVGTLKLQAGGPDKEASLEAMGRLMRMGGLPFQMDQQLWENMTPDQHGEMISLALGYENPNSTEALNRHGNAANALFATGRFDTYNDALKAARGERTNMKPDLERMIQEASHYHMLRNIGLTGDQAKRVSVLLANGVPMADAVPSTVVSALEREIGLREWALQQGDVQNLMGWERLDLDWWEAQKQWSIEEAKLLMETLGGETDDLFDRIDGLVSLQREGIDVDQEVMDGVINEVANRGGLTAERVGSMLGFLGFRDDFRYTPFISRDLSAMTEEAAGAPQEPSEELQEAAEGISIFSRRGGQTNPRAFANEASQERQREAREAGPTTTPEQDIGELERRVRNATNPRTRQLYQQRLDEARARLGQ